jgi:hypothetical protein
MMKRFTSGSIYALQSLRKRLKSASTGMFFSSARAIFSNTPLRTCARLSVTDCLPKSDVAPNATAERRTDTSSKRPRNASSTARVFGSAENGSAAPTSPSCFRSLRVMTFLSRDHAVSIDVAQSTARDFCGAMAMPMFDMRISCLQSINDAVTVGTV